MKLNVNLIIIISLFTSLSFAQQIGDGFSTHITDFSAALRSGTYQGLSPLGTNPDVSYSGWQHLFVIRHGNEGNNHQLQLSSSYSENDRLFFRKIANSNSSWYELATRGANKFKGNQIIIDNLSIGTENIGFQTKLNVKETGTSNSIWRGRIIASGDINAVVMGEYDSKAWLGAHNSQLNAWSDLIIQGGGGNVGIGTTNPTAKLTVAGNIASREVKVSVDAGADFVFEDDYNLSSLDSVDKYIKEIKHLPEIASADEMKKEGINLSEMNIKLLQKIEELTLYAIEQNKKIEQQAKEIEILKTLAVRIAKIEYDLSKK